MLRLTAHGCNVPLHGRRQFPLWVAAAGSLVGCPTVKVELRVPWALPGAGGGKMVNVGNRDFPIRMD